MDHVLILSRLHWRIYKFMVIASLCDGTMQWFIVIVEDLRFGDLLCAMRLGEVFRVSRMLVILERWMQSAMWKTEFRLIDGDCNLQRMFVRPKIH